MTFVINWTDIPTNVRKKITKVCILESSEFGISGLHSELAKFNCVYNNRNQAIFESEAHYNWFLIKWC